MQSNNQNFLGTLYFERFTVSAREKTLRNTRYSVSNEAIRNDQSISEASRHGDMIDRLISRFLDLAD